MLKIKTEHSHDSRAAQIEGQQIKNNIKNRAINTVEVSNSFILTKL